MYPTILCGRMPQHSVFELMTITSGVHSLVRAHSFRYYARLTHYESCCPHQTHLKLKFQVFLYSKRQKQGDGESHPTCCHFYIQDNILCGKMPQHSVFELVTVPSGAHSFEQAHSFRYYARFTRYESYCPHQTYLKLKFQVFLYSKRQRCLQKSYICLIQETTIMMNRIWTIWITKL